MKMSHVYTDTDVQCVYVCVRACVCVPAYIHVSVCVCVWTHAWASINTNEPNMPTCVMYISAYYALSHTLHIQSLSLKHAHTHTQANHKYLSLFLTHTHTHARTQSVNLHHQAHTLMHTSIYHNSHTHTHTESANLHFHAYAHACACACTHTLSKLAGVVWGAREEYVSSEEDRAPV